MVEEIPYLQLPHESEEQKEEKYGHIETDEEIDGSLKINFKEMLAEESDRQIESVYVPKDPMVERSRLPVGLASRKCWKNGKRQSVRQRQHCRKQSSAS